MRALLFALGLVNASGSDLEAIRVSPEVANCKRISVEWDLNIDAEPTVLRRTAGGRCHVAVGARV